MSRSNNTEVVSPVVRKFDWVGSKGCLKYFDKTKGEKGEDVLVKLPFTFLMLDKLSTIRGFSDADQSGYWSNEVRNLKTDTLTVKTKKGTQATGLYKDLAAIMSKGAQFCQLAYIAFKDETGTFQIGTFAITGSAIGSWFEFCKGKDIYKYAVTVASARAEKKGTTNYFVPVYQGSEKIAPETEARAIELDKTLQEYMKAYFKNTNAEQAEITSTDVLTEQQKKDIEDFQPDTEGLEPLDNFTSTHVDEMDDLPF